MTEAEEQCGLKGTDIQKKLARKRVFDSYMNDETKTSTPPKGQFADPMAMVRAQ